MFLGMRGNGDWVTDQRPKNWREQILKLYPNGKAPLTAMLSMMKSQSVDDPEFYWWTQEQSTVQGTVSGIYTDPNCSAAYVSGGVVGSVVYALITTTLANRIRKGHQILLRDADDFNVDCVGKVIDVSRGTTNSVLAVKLIEADDNSTTHDLSDCDYFKIIGNINAEGSEMPDAIALNPTKVYNRTQIFRTSLSITRTARKTRLRTGDQYQKAKAEALEMHSWEEELAFIWGVGSEGTGENGKPERTTTGLVNFIKTYAPLNCLDYSLDADYAGMSWETGGEDWFDNSLEQIFRYGAGEKLILAGSGFVLGMQKLVKEGANISVAPSIKAYGMNIMSWFTPFGEVRWITHPLFSMDETTRNMGIIFEPAQLNYRFIDDTQFFGEGGKTHAEGYGQKRVDATNEEFLTEAGLEWGEAKVCGIFNGVGLDNEVSE
jgi:hypothetical protein